MLISLAVIYVLGWAITALIACFCTVVYSAALGLDTSSMPVWLTATFIFASLWPVSWPLAYLLLRPAPKYDKEGDKEWDTSQTPDR